MKYRTNVSFPDGAISDNIPERAGYKTLTYKLKVITPIYGGGVEAGTPDKDMPIRATTIRGQLRYWWRFLQMSHPKKLLQDEKLFKEERKIWGGMTDDPQKDGSSKVFITINSIQKTINKKKASEYRQNGIKYALFPAIQNNEDVLEPNIEFQLEATTCNLDDEQHESVKEAIRWWICFGGIGARTRRGLGSVECTHSNSDFSPLDCKKVSQYGCELSAIEASDAMRAWDKAVSKLQHFRQVEFIYNRNQDHEVRGIGRRTKQEQKNNDDTQKTYPSRSNWPEPDTLREITGKDANGSHQIEHHNAVQSFPRAAFGLPIIFDFNVPSWKGEPPKTELTPKGKNVERMASPLILKAMKNANNQYESIALLLPHNHIDTLELSLNYSGFNKYKQDEEKRICKLNNQQLRDEEIRKLGELKNKLPKYFNKPNKPNSDDPWWSDNKANNVLTINNRGTNALDAFMTFFEKGGK